MKVNKKLKESNVQFLLVQTGIAPNGMFHYKDIYFSKALVELIIGQNKGEIKHGLLRDALRSFSDLTHGNPTMEDVLNKNTYVPTEFFDMAKKRPGFILDNKRDPRYFAIAGEL